VRRSTQTLLWRHAISRYVNSVENRTAVCVGPWRWMGGIVLKSVFSPSIFMKLGMFSSIMCRCSAALCAAVQQHYVQMFSSIMCRCSAELCADVQQHYVQLSNTEFQPHWTINVERTDRNSPYSRNTTAQLHNCTTAQLQNSTTAQQHNCTIAQLHNCTTAQLHNSTTAQ